jgi:SAM-dependent MidA family methyltransferase
MTFAEFMGHALYHPEFGYYAGAAVRSGRAGDFMTSVDLGPLFGELLARQFAEMWHVLGAEPAFDLVEAASGNGRLARDVLDAARTSSPPFYDAIRLHLVERSRIAREAAGRTLSAHERKIASTGEALPERVHGAVFANELLDALPTHAVAMTDDGLREIYVDAEGDELVERAGPLSSPAINSYLTRLGVRLEPGWRTEVNLAATAWVQQAARSLARGFLVLIDYGHQARELYSATHSAGTLATFARHATEGAVSRRRAPWLTSPGARDLTAHVDLTSVRDTAEASGLVTLGVVDQTYFLLNLGLQERVPESRADTRIQLQRRLSLKSLLLPGGIGSTHKVMIFGRDVGSPVLQGLRGGRLTW